MLTFNLYSDDAIKQLQNGNKRHKNVIKNKKNLEIFIKNNIKYHKD